MVLFELRLTVREAIHFSSQFPVGSVGGVVMLVPSLALLLTVRKRCSRFPHVFPSFVSGC